MNLFRVKADASLCTNEPPSPGTVRPILTAFGRRLRIERAGSPDRSRMYDPDTGDYIDVCSSIFLEPWVEGERWNGSAWVADPVADPVAVTLRDRFAMAALPAWIARGHIDADDAASRAYALADAMIAARGNHG